MADKCGTCLNLNLKEKSAYGDKYWCRERKNYFEVSDYACSYYNEDPNRVRNSSDCYITTIICNVLGYDDNCELLNTLRDFRDNYLKAHPEYYDLLLEYDITGPQISHCIFADENKYPLALIISQAYLVPCANYIKNGNFEEAITIYKNMVHHLMQCYNIAPVKINKRAMTIDMDLLGKARTRHQRVNIKMQES